MAKLEITTYKSKKFNGNDLEERYQYQAVIRLDKELFMIKLKKASIVKQFCRDISILIKILYDQLTYQQYNAILHKLSKDHSFYLNGQLYVVNVSDLCLGGAAIDKKYASQ